MRILLVCLILAAACSRRPKAEPAATPTTVSKPAAKRPVATSTSRSIVGSYRFTAVNKTKVPAEFPVGSGARLENGTLELQSNSRFAMRFGARAREGDDLKTSGESGRYRIVGDTLYFTADGKESQPPVTFRYTRTSSGLNLIDSRGNTWAYSRK